MSNAMAKAWWVFLIRGICAILFGIMAIVVPGLTLASLVLLFGAYAIIDGIAACFYAFSSRNTDQRWWTHLLEGVIGILAGILIMVLPGIAAITAVYVIAFWAVLTGVMEIAGAIRLRNEIDNEVWLGLGGLLSIIFGVWAFLFPGEGALALVLVIGIYAIVFGIFFIMLALRLRGLHTPTGTPVPSRP